MSNNFNVTATLNDDGTISCKWFSVAGAELYHAESGKDVVYDYGSLDIMYFTIFYDKQNGFTMLPYNAGTIEYNYSQYGLSRIP